MPGAGHFIYFLCLFNARASSEAVQGTKTCLKKLTGGNMLTVMNHSRTLQKEALSSLLPKAPPGANPDVASGGAIFCLQDWLLFVPDCLSNPYHLPQIFAQLLGTGAFFS